MTLILLGSESTLAQVDLIVNGDFEGGFVPDGSCDLFEPDTDQLPTAWSCFETFSTGAERSLINAFPQNGPSAPGFRSARFYRGDLCHLSGDWTTIEQGIRADVTSCRKLTLGLDVMLVPTQPPSSHNLGGSGHVGGPCDPSGFEHPATVVVRYTDISGVARCWQYGWYQYAATQADRTDPDCFSGFDGINANPDPAVSQQIPVGVWVANSFDLLSILGPVQTIDAIRVGGSGWTFGSAVDNISLICEPEVIPCEQSPLPECLGECPPGTACVPVGATGCRCEPVLCEQGPFPECFGDCPPGTVCVPDADSGACRCLAPCEESPFAECLGDCPPGTACIPDPATGLCHCAPVCEDTFFPECLGACPPGTFCAPDTTGVCRCEPESCDASPFPECLGQCPTGTTCVPDDVAGVCTCLPLDCEQGPFPECLGQCPPGTVCEPDPAIGACRCVPVPCEQSPFPECLGDCPPGTTCVIDDNGLCRCQPECVQSPFPECLGDCPPGTTCVPDDVTGFCTCLPADCEQGPFPECFGECPPGAVCVGDPTGAACRCEPVPCEQSPFAECLGDCPPGTTCVPDPDTGVCRCEPICEESPYPECLGNCPPGTDCVPDPTGVVACRCEPAPCEQGPFPECFGDCPPGTVCVANAATNTCRCELLACEQTFPECFGDCPPGTVCVPDPTSGCRCEAVPCEQSPFPECRGECPPGTVCVPDPDTGCRCEPVPCEQSPFRECLGECPPGTVCTPDTVTGVCRCEPVPCEQGLFPECLGDCPPDQECVPDLLTGVCECAPPPPPPCDQSPFPECLGDCPFGEICAPSSILGPCECQPPPPCDQSPFPECLGDCPPGTSCVPDATNDGCVCSTVGEECTQCGPGPHFVDACGPFPPVGVDLVSNNSAIVGIDVDLDCVIDVSLALTPCPVPHELLHIDKVLGPIDDSVHFPGTSPVDGHPTGPGLDVIDTEIVELCLSNGMFTLVAGTGGPSMLPLLPSLGTVAEDLTTPDPTIADSFFDVFFEVQGMPGGPVYNQTPLRVQGRIDCLPPKARYNHPVGICLPLTTAGVCNGGIYNGNPCVADLDCPDGSCEGEVVLANLVSATHSVNQPACNDSLFPECLGDCPPGTVCVPDPSGACRCEPVCSDTFFPECDGVCPPDQQCVNVPGTDNCRCAPLPPPCEQTEFPVCDGSCPPDQRCAIADDLCRCTPCTVVPPGEVKGVFFPDKGRFRWLPLPCANVYNVYRFTGRRYADADNNSLADDYGSCFLPDLLVPEANDGSTPPSGFLHHYLVTGENALGEGILGYNSNLTLRPNTTPCP